MSTEQQYRVIGKSGPGVEPVVGYQYKCGLWIASYPLLSVTSEQLHLACGWIPREWWDAGLVDILEAISPPQAAPVVCLQWCGDEYSKSCVPGKIANYPPHANSRGQVMCWRDLDRSGYPTGPAYCTQACLDRAKAAKAPAHSPVMTHGERAALLTRCPVHGGGNCGATCAGRGKAPECIRAACKAPSVAGGELCAAHAGQVEAVKAKCCAWKNGVSACGRPSVGGRLCTKHEAELRASDAKPSPPPTETRLERWRREHKGYSHGTADPRVHDANVAAMMVGIDGPREPYVPPAPLAAWTPRDLDGDIPDAHERGGVRLRR